jgi:hypothetical protein
MPRYVRGRRSRDGDLAEGGGVIGIWRRKENERQGERMLGGEGALADIYI